MNVRAFGSVAAAAAVVLALSGCGNSGSGSGSGTTLPRATTSSSGAASSTSSTVASEAASASSVVASLPVVACQTDYAIATTTTTVLPPSVSVRVPSNKAADLAVYGDTQGIIRLVAPKDGWTCHGTFGADGSGGLVVSPAGTRMQNGGNGWHVAASSPIEAITANETGGSPVQGAASVCALFADAATAYAQDGIGPCTTRPPQEMVTTISAAAVGFEDPAGIAGDGFPSGGLNTANGVALYKPRATEPDAYVATCTLAASQHHLCTAVLNHFIASYG